MKSGTFLLALIVGGVAATSGCATYDAAPAAAGHALEQVKQFAVSADALQHLMCTEPGKSAVKSALVQTGVIEPDSVDKACTDADLGLDVGYEAINQLADVLNALSGY